MQDTVGKRGATIITRYLIDDNTLVATVSAKSDDTQMLRYYERVGPAPVLSEEQRLHSTATEAAAVATAAAAPAPAAPATAPVAATAADTTKMMSSAAQRELETFLTVPFVDVASASDRVAQSDTGVVSETEGMPFTHSCCWEQMVQAYFWRMLNNRFVSNSTVRPTDCATQREVAELASRAYSHDVWAWVRVCHVRACTRNGRAGHICSNQFRCACSARGFSIQHLFEGTVGDALHCGKWERLLAPKIIWVAY